MIEFRYHLVSIIAIFLALAIGIVLGSAVFGSPFLNELRGRVAAVKDANSHLRRENDQLRAVLGANRRFAETVEPFLVRGALHGRSVVVISLPSTDAGVTSSLLDEIATAGGSVSGTLSLTDRLALGDPDSRAQLRALVGGHGKATQLRVHAARELGQRMAAAAHNDARGGLAEQLQPGKQLRALLGGLERDDFVTLGTGDSPQVVPPGARFLIVAGGNGPSPFNAAGFVRALAHALGRGGTTVTVASPSFSTWNVIPALRNDPGISEAGVSTVDDADTVPGRISSVLALRRAPGRRGMAYGVGPGADTIVPTPLPVP